MKTKNPDHHPAILVMRGSEATFHAANVQIWATGHFLSGLVKYNRNNNNQLGFYKARLDMLVWLNNVTNIFLPAAHCQTTSGLFQKAKTLFSVGLYLYLYLYVVRDHFSPLPLLLISPGAGAKQSLIIILSWLLIGARCEVWGI